MPYSKEEFRKPDNDGKRAGKNVFYRPMTFFLIIVAIIFVMGVFFEISVINVEGNEIYSAQEIINASGIHTGDNLFFINRIGAGSRVVVELPYVESVSITRSLPNAITVKVNESHAVAYISVGQELWTVSRSGKLLGAVKEAEPSRYPFIKGLALDNGGHLTHGAPVSFSGKYYKAVNYHLDPKTERLDYDAILVLAKKVKPKVIVAGYSAYPRKINFKKFREICNKVGAYLMVDMAHIAGLIAAGEHPSPFPYADVVTSTTHKTLRGPRSGIILTNNPEIAKKVDKAIFPGLQGGPLMHIIAAKAVAFKMANTAEFRHYIKDVIKNSKALAQGLKVGGLRLVTGGTDNHLCLADVSVAGVTGKDVENACAKANITINKNTIPGDKQSPFVTSGIRVGTPAVTSRDFTEANCFDVGKGIARIAFNIKDKGTIEDVKHSMEIILNAHPLYV